MSEQRQAAPSETLPGPTLPGGKEQSLSAKHLSPEMVAICKGLDRIIRGDYRTPIDAETDDPGWQGLTDQINRANEGAQRAIKQAEDSRREAATARDEALAAARSETCFLTNVSHEIRTPLASIRSAVEILRMYPEEPMETRIEFLDIILAGADRLSSLVDQVLDLGRIQAGRVRWDYRRTEIAATITDSLSAFTPVACRFGVILDVELEPGLPLVFADPERMKQLWTSLIDNALKFRGDSDRVEIRARSIDSTVEVTVRDFGIGIQAEDQDDIFQRFFQVTHGLTNKPEGAGLGLSIAKNIVASHEGSIVVESREGGGALFRVTLPVMRT